MTDRDSFTARPGEPDEGPDSSPLPSQDRVTLRCREQFSNLPRIAPTRRCRTHEREYCPSRLASSGPQARRVDAAKGALSYCRAPQKRNWQGANSPELPNELIGDERIPETIFEVRSCRSLAEPRHRRPCVGNFGTPTGP
jgi:hypothetical protein